MELLSQQSEKMFAMALEGLSRAHLKHYEQAGIEKNKERLKKLYDLTVQSINDKNLYPMIKYSEKVAEERFQGGFDLHEVHTAYNILEETIWKKITEELPASDIAVAFGLITTVLGTGKHSLALKYVSLASKTKAKTLDLSALFKGTEGT